MGTGIWQGRLDLNQRMAGSKPAALPLGDAPKVFVECWEVNGRGGWIRTNAWQDQNLLPYRLATPLSVLTLEPHLLPCQFS